MQLSLWWSYLQTCSVFFWWYVISDGNMLLFVFRTFILPSFVVAYAHYCYAFKMAYSVYSVTAKTNKFLLFLLNRNYSTVTFRIVAHQPTCSMPVSWITPTSLLARPPAGPTAACRLAHPSNPYLTVWSCLIIYIGYV